MIITPKTEAHFNVPPDNPYVIQGHVYDLLESADAGSIVSWAIFEMGDQPGGKNPNPRRATDAIRDAYARGVNIHLIADQASLAYPDFASLHAFLNNNNNPDIRRPSWSLINYGGGVGDNINHDKFFLFESVQGHKKVWVQSSANLTDTKSWNNCVTGVGHPQIYDGYLTRHNAMKTAAVSGKHHKAPYTTVDDGTFKAYFYPEPPSKNTLLDIVNNVTGGKGTYIDIACYHFLLPEVATALKRLAKRGVRVRLAYTNAAVHSEEVADIIRSAPGSKVTRFDNNSSYSLPYNYLHSKYMIIDGEYLGKRSKIVWTGSLNFTKNALYNNDESVVRFYGPGPLWDAYGADFDPIINKGQMGTFTVSATDGLVQGDGSAPTTPLRERDAFEDAGLNETTQKSSYEEPI